MREVLQTMQNLLVYSKACRWLSLRISQIILWKRDSTIVINWGRGEKVGSWRLSHFIYEIRGLVEDLKIMLHHVPHAKNSLANKVAKWSVG